MSWTIFGARLFSGVRMEEDGIKKKEREIPLLFVF